MTMNINKRICAFSSSVSLLLLKVSVFAKGLDFGTNPIQGGSSDGTIAHGAAQGDEELVNSFSSPLEFIMNIMRYAGLAAFIFGAVTFLSGFRDSNASNIQKGAIAMAVGAGLMSMEYVMRLVGFIS